MKRKKIKKPEEWGAEMKKLYERIFPNGYKTFVLKPNEKREKLGLKK